MSAKLKAILVDDEESARNVLTNLLNRFCPQIEVIETCTNVLSAVEAIKRHNPDVVFLDIEMPNYAGYELVSFFEHVTFDIIFVTAYDKYAIKAFEISAVDYLLKPVEIDRLKQAVEKLVVKNNLLNPNKNYNALKDNLKAESISKIVVRKNDGQEIVAIDDIIAIEAQESYSCIHTISDNYLMSKNLKHFETIFEQNNSFFRSHKSWMINLNKVKSFSKTKLEIELENGIVAKLSKYKKPEFEEVMMC
ncbi:MAG: response regulator [Flavobacteriales bacterium]|nr:response regulator [Flavobacteriales bacterium]MCB9174993.1 response regulator [Flavobacteriales bacterium]